MDVSKVMDMLLKEYSSFRHPTLRRSSKLNNPFKTLISCLLSLRTQDKNTEIASSRLFAVADTPESILKLRIDKLEKLIFSSGHYKKKSKILKSVCKELLERFEGNVPRTREELMSIKGVGPKTASIVLCFAFGDKNCIPTDVHVHVIANRLKWVKTKLAEKTELELMRVVPKKYWSELNTLFVLHGQKVCTTLSPKCSICCISKYCPRFGVNKNR
jgi:endonuclease-3